MSINRSSNLSVLVLNKLWGANTEKLVNGWPGCHSRVSLCLCFAVFVVLKIYRFWIKTRFVLTLPSQSKTMRENYLKIYFHTPLWCVKRFYQGLYKFKLIFILIEFSEMHARVNMPTKKYKIMILIYIFYRFLLFITANLFLQIYF